MSSTQKDMKTKVLTRCLPSRLLVHVNNDHQSECLIGQNSAFACCKGAAFHPLLISLLHYPPTHTHHLPPFLSCFFCKKDEARLGHAAPRTSRRKRFSVILNPCLFLQVFFLPKIRSGREQIYEGHF